MEYFRVKETTYIEFLGRPSAGKSTTAYGVFAELKRKGYKTEFVAEYAKELVYSKDSNKLSNQLLVTGEQTQREDVLNGVVDIVVTDTSTLLGNIYNTKFDEEAFKSVVDKCRDGKKYITFFVTNREGEYREYGRTQTKEEALAISDKVGSMLNQLNVEYFTIDKSEGVIGVMSKIKELGVI